MYGLEGDIGFYLILNSGLCIYKSESVNLEVDSQLIGGFSAALINFNSSLINNCRGNPDFLNVKTRINDVDLEYLINVGEVVAALIVLRDHGELSKIAYSELMELNKSLINYVEDEFKDDIDKLTGELTNDKLDSFVKEKVDLMKEHIYSSYLLSILSLTNYYKVKVSNVLKLISSVNKVDPNNYEEIHAKNEEIKLEMINLSEEKRSKTFNRIIKYINEHYHDVWALFKVPLIKPKII